MTEHAAPTPSAPVDPKLELMANLLKDIFAPFEPEMGYAIDEVSLTISPKDIVAACKLAKENEELKFDYLRCLSVVDYEEHFQVVYHLYSMKKHHKMVLKVNLPKDNPRVSSVVSVWKGADWHEREGAELFGVTFEEHPNLAPLLLYEGFEGYPMLKSYPLGPYEDGS
ncbi:MAG: NADH-quinone oxidoreductase subunit C [Chloroflexi bacterium]|nr:NADH-quinone oxidoreductase subunit C [Chloroflexota bacterium]